MDMEYYRNFIAIVEAGSLSAASKRVHVAQPALSNQLKLLQKKFGTQLVNIRRGVHNIELTNAGCILYNKAKYLCSLEDDTQREISDCVNGFFRFLAKVGDNGMKMQIVKIEFGGKL